MKQINYLTEKTNDAYLHNNSKKCTPLILFSYDTEALNKSILPETFIDEAQFQSHTTQKLTYGVQQLYTIGNFVILTVYVFTLIIRCFF